MLWTMLRDVRYWRRLPPAGLTAVTAAGAQTNEPLPQPMRPGHGGTDPGPRNLARDSRIPICWFRLPPIRARFPICASRSPDAHMRLESGGWTRRVTQLELGVQARMGVFAASGQGRTFDFQAGDVGYVPFATGHYIENTGTTPLRFLEVFKSSYHADVSLNQWLALTPPELVQAHLKVDPQTLAALHKEKFPVVPG